MHNPGPVLENDSHKLLWDFNIQTDQPNPGQKTRLKALINKKRELAK